MDFQLGTFTAVFASGIALNLGFPFLRQAREFGLSEIEKEIRKVFKEVKIEICELECIDPEIGKYCHKKLKEVIEIFENALEKLKNKPMKKRISFCIVASILCVIGLSLCALFGGQTLSLSKWTGKSFLYITYGLSFLPLPIALVWTFAENIRIKKRFLKKIEPYQELTRKKLEEAINDLDDKVE